MHTRFNLKRLTAFSAVVASLVALLSSSLVSTSSASESSQLQAKKNAAAQLNSEITAESQAISKSATAVASAKQQLATEQASLNRHEQELKKVQVKLVAARDHLVKLENKLRVTSGDLASNLREMYENGNPNLVDVVLQSSGFQNLLQQVDFLKRTQDEDAQIVHMTSEARKRVLAFTVHLGNLEMRDRTLTNDIRAQRNHVAAIEEALTKRQIAQEQSREHDKSQLSHVNASISSLQAKIAAQIKKQQEKLAAEQAAATQQAEQTPVETNQQVGGIAVDTGGMVQAPAGAPEAVKQMIAAGNAIATLPYIWGGGHASFQAAGYDCSGSTSYVLAAAGLLSSPEVSGWFESYGQPGPGRWVTIYANSIHVWMEIAGWRFDTVALAEDGTRWSQGGGEYSGFVVRHPDGL
jgi:septal ring factor EnvC (AmiA/AmiB activator)